MAGAAGGCGVQRGVQTVRLSCVQIQGPFHLDLPPFNPLHQGGNRFKTLMESSRDPRLGEAGVELTRGPLAKLHGFPSRTPLGDKGCIPFSLSLGFSSMKWAG